MLNIGPQELLVILVVALLVVGPSRLPELGRTLGRGLRELRRAQDEVQRTIRTVIDEPAPAPRPRGQRPSRPAGDEDGSAPDGGSEPPAEPQPSASTTAAAVSEAVRAAERAEPEAAPDEPAANEVARTLGRSLAELRRAREEIARTLRGELDDRGPGTR
jgi:sec-independent protein translocase protein TatA